MKWDEVFVGGVTIVIGAFSLLAAAVNWEAAYQLRLGRWFDERYGRRVARCFYAVVGLLLVILGIALAMGFGPNKSIRLRSSTSGQWLPAYRCTGARCPRCIA